VYSSPAVSPDGATIGPWEGDKTVYVLDASRGANATKSLLASTVTLGRSIFASLIPSCLTWALVLL